ncbi:isochorismate synthase [Nocardioides phosphati]|uniref:isochorismate synthase n=1 Tax=Nocardioides phosphati TaxID=1867775 RepID=A0ABQ2NFF0_9ACTN|nr:isochorismate synthase [Nocardioides phosphati]GGO94211.1 isochorismate synthase [Nocardioides phosphati]
MNDAGDGGSATRSALDVRTVLVPASDPAASAALIDLLPADAPLSWLRRGEGLVGWGVAATVRTSGPTRFSDAAKWWTETVAAATVEDSVDEPGTGLVCFGTFTFSDEPPADDFADGDSVLVVPQVVVGRRGDLTWLTTIGVADAHVEVADAPAPPVDLTFADGALSGDEWMEVVADAVSRIEAGDLEKIVLARDLVATAAAPIDIRWPLRRLAAAYPTCWTFHVDGLFGATPEMLVRRERGLVTSRVLAGTIRRTGDDERDLALAAMLAHSSKDLEEHEYAVRSVAEALEPYCSSMNVPETPFVLHLPNVLHLATDVAGVARDGESALELAAALHPSAAVGGTPTPVARALITEIEGMDRGRYAAPVGWMDATGDGEWGIALRSGVLHDNQVRLFAGCGIVGGSDPEAELAESQAKFVPVREALGG